MAMIRNQRGFTLIEIVIAFTILTMGTVLVVNVVTQSSTRVSKVNEHLVAMDVLESAVAIVRGEIANRKLQQSYRSEQNDKYQWEARIVGKANPAIEGIRQYMNLYWVQIQVFHDSDRPRLELTTIIADR
jgi:prepilin-type N-terminal cleavage/methylation domain-containing protein